MSDILVRNAKLRSRLLATLGHTKIQSFDQEATTRETFSEQTQFTTVDVIITHIEVNNRHGVGVLVNRLFGKQPNIFSIRSQDLYGGEHSFGVKNICLSYHGHSRVEMFERVIQAFKGVSVTRILCIPYFADDVQSALLIKEIFNAPLCTFIMDDQNISANGIPDSLMSELVSKSKLCLAISPDLQQAYGDKYHRSFYFLPPGVPNHLIANKPSKPKMDPCCGIMIGNIWSQRWLDLLRNTLRGAGIEITWYCNGGSKCSWLDLDPQALARDGILLRDPLESEEALVLQLRASSFAIIPSGTLDDQDDHQAIAQFSLPSRIPFILATANTPLLVLGSQKTAAARFVRGFGVGLSCNYEIHSFQRAVSCILSADAQYQMRTQAVELSECFGCEGMSDWIWQSLDEGKACSSRLDKLSRLDKQCKNTNDHGLEGILCSHF